MIDIDALTDQQRQQLAAVGMLGVNVKRIVKHRASDPDEVIAARMLESIGSRQLCAFTVMGRAVPWSAYKVGRQYLASRKRMTKWQDKIRDEASFAFGIVQPPFHGPVAIRIGLSFFLKGQPPDVTNCQKAIEDAMERVVYVNDKQVNRISTERIFTDGSPEHATIVVEMF